MNRVPSRRKVVDHPGDQILRTLTGRLFGHPQFKILVAIVVALPILVMYVLPRVQFAPEALFHDVSVLQNSSALANVNIPVSGLVQVSASVSQLTPMHSGAGARASLAPEFMGRFQSEWLLADDADVLNFGFSASARAELRSRPGAEEFLAAARAGTGSLDKRLPLAVLPVAGLGAGCSTAFGGCGDIEFFQADSAFHEVFYSMRLYTTYLGVA